MDVNHIGTVVSLLTNKAQAASEPIPAILAERIRAEMRERADRRGLNTTQALQTVIEYGPNYIIRAGKRRNVYATDRRGLMLIGDPGCGKTVAMQFMASITGAYLVTAAAILESFLVGGDVSFYSRSLELAVEPIVIDDLGAEREAAHFGNASPISEWLQRRYAHWQTGGPEMHIVTNLTPAEISRRYGERVLDRLHECCVIVPITATSMRRNSVICVREDKT